MAQWGFPTKPHLRVDSFSILSSHRSFRKPDPFPWVSRGFLERFGSLERMRKVALEKGGVSLCGEFKPKVSLFFVGAKTTK